MAAAGDVVDLDPLYRAPFRDAAAQAYASLRAGLGCAHVELASLPEPVRDLCDRAARTRTAQASRGSDGGPAGAGVRDPPQGPDGPGPG